MKSVETQLLLKLYPNAPHWMISYLEEGRYDLSDCKEVMRLLMFNQKEEEEKYSARIQWGTKEDRKEMYLETHPFDVYNFKTREELSAFLEGTEASAEWSEYLLDDEIEDFN